MIEIQEITYRYPQARENALNGVSLPVAEGAALGLLGPNGAGKTTLMSLLAGLLPVQGGQILFDGVPLGRLPAKERQRISLVPQDFAFYPLLSVWDNMRFFAALYAVRDEGYLKHPAQPCVTITPIFSHHTIYHAHQTHPARHQRRHCCL